MNFNEYYYEDQITDEMNDWFDNRTAKHISLVQKYGNKIAQLDGFEKLGDQVKKHDQSKFEDPEKTPYIFVSWQYKCKDDGVEYNPPENIKDQMNKATEHHVKSNSHHPEYYSPQEVDLINREDRDSRSNEIIDATKMSFLDIAEMVADWCAMSEEKGNTPKEWADKNVNKRWKFTDDQTNLIYDLIEKVWDDEI